MKAFTNRALYSCDPSNQPMHPRTVLSLHSKSPRKSFGALSGNIAFCAARFFARKTACVIL